MKITMVHPPLTTELGFIAALVILLCLGGCGGGSDSAEQESGLSELVAMSQGYQAKPLDLRSANVQSALLDLFDQSGESSEDSPMLYQRLHEELNEEGAELNGTAEVDATISEVLRSSSGEVSVRSSLDVHDDHVFILFLHAFIDAEGKILGTPERQEFFVPEGGVEVSASSYSSDLSQEITALSIFAVENRSGNFSLYGASFKSPTMQSSASSAALSTQRVASGCLAAGTQITLADGSKIPVEKVTPGMKVVVNKDGAVSTVQDTSSGVEPYPMIHLITSNGAEILATRTHPFFMQSGPKLAKYIKKGDSVSTMNGVLKLTSVTQEMYGGRLHNFSVTRDPATAYPSFVANGFVVGDITTQNKLMEEERHPEQRADDVILGQLPQEWHPDFLSSKQGTRLSGAL